MGRPPLTDEQRAQAALEAVERVTDTLRIKRQVTAREERDGQ